MLDEFLNTVYTHETRKKAEYYMVGLLKDIPTLELRKLASGTPIAELYEKRAMMDECTSPDAQPKTFLDKFKDTPLFEEALALEQEMLQAEAADIEARMQRRGEDQLYQVQDQIRLKKRLLELKLAKLQAGGGEEPGAPPAAPPGEPAQGAGAPGPVPAEGVQDNSQGLGGGAAKMAAVSDLHPVSWPLNAVTGYFGHQKGKEMAEQGQPMDQPSLAAGLLLPGWAGYRIGKHLGHSGATKAMQDNAQGLGGGVAKSAMSPVSAVKAVQPFVHGSNIASGVGAAIGGAAGLANGLKKDEQGQRHVLRGAAEGLGGAMGGSLLGGAGHLGATYAAHPEAREAIKTVGKGLWNGSIKAGAADLVQFSDSFARALARGDFEKAARVQTLTKVGEAAAATLSKTALDMGGMLGAVKPLATKALGMAAKNPALAGAAIGAGAGALAGGKDNRLGGALGGAALGAGAGHAAGGISAGMKGGLGFADAAKSYGGGILQKAKSVMPGAGGAAPEATAIPKALGG
jgi:hypothetical protein